MKQFTFLFIVFISFTASAQRTNNKKALEAYEKALLQLRDGLVKDAIPLLGKALEYDPNYTDAYLSLAGVYGELKHYQKAIEFYDKARNKDSAFFKYYWLPYSINLAGLGKFDKALETVNQFLSIPSLGEKSIKSAHYRKASYEFALTYQQQHTNSNYIFSPINLGDSINSDQSEYYPSMTIDDSIFVFTRNQTGFSEDFMESKRQQKNYSKARVLNGDINVHPRKGAINISQDGEWLIFAGDFPKGFGGFDLYISYNTPTGWSEPMNLGSNINTEFWESAPSLSPDKNALYFTSNRPEGSGAADLYVSYRQSNSKFGPAINMGPTINTVGTDQAPFIHADNKTLYYTSDGLPGYGGSDLYVVRKQVDGKWSTPENLGYPINTIENEGSLFITAAGIQAYYASDRSDSKGGLDLYKFDLREDIRPSKTLYVEGTVSDAKTKKPLPSTVELIDNNSRQSISKVQTDETGYYFITLPIGNDYTFIVNRRDYLFYSDLYELSKKTADSTYRKDIALQPIEINTSVTLKNIQFDFKSYQLQSVSLIELDKLYQFLIDNATVKILISGHTDNVGNETDNLKLSENRSKAVRMYLANRGIAIERMTVKGYGETKPVANNNTEEGKEKNRRTEFTVTSMQ